MLSFNKFNLYLKLIRFDKPIGTLLLLWPTWIALWLSGHGVDGHFDFNLKNWVIFTLGVFLMRSVGCIINDIADRDFDKHVERTQLRPLTQGQVSVGEAIALAMALAVMAFVLVCFTNWPTVMMSFIALGLATIYPFLKRYTHFPQVVLGLAFAMAVPMAFMAQTLSLPQSCWWLFLATVIWAVAYDTLYAMVDKVDDLKIGIKSTAVRFGRFSQILVGLCHLGTLLCYAMIGHLLQLNILYFAAVVFATLLAVQQHWQIRHGQREAYFKAFLDNNRIGAVLCLGAFLSYV